MKSGPATWVLTVRNLRHAGYSSMATAAQLHGERNWVVVNHNTDYEFDETQKALLYFSNMYLYAYTRASIINTTSCKMFVKAENQDKNAWNLITY